MLKIYRFFTQFFLYPEEKNAVDSPYKIMNLWTLTFRNKELEEKYSNKEK